jgi:hypothetical protein
MSIVFEDIRLIIKTTIVGGAPCHCRHCGTDTYPCYHGLWFQAPSIPSQGCADTTTPRLRRPPSACCPKTTGRQVEAGAEHLVKYNLQLVAAAAAQMVPTRPNPAFSRGSCLHLIYRSEYRAGSRMDLALCSTKPCGIESRSLQMDGKEMLGSRSQRGVWPWPPRSCRISWS